MPATPKPKFVGTSLPHVAIIGIPLEMQVMPDQASRMAREEFQKRLPNAFVLKDQMLGARTIKRKGYAIYAFTFADP